MNALSREALVFRALYWEAARHYDEMKEAIAMVIRAVQDHSLAEIIVFASACKYISSRYRDGIFVLRAGGPIAAREQSERETAWREQVVTALKHGLVEFCTENIALVHRYVVPHATDEIRLVAVHKLLGDFYRYLAEVASGDDRDRYRAEAETHYTQAQTTATVTLTPTSPLRLEVALNYAALQADGGNIRRAGEMVSESFGEAENWRLVSHRDTALPARAAEIMQRLSELSIQWV
ncbi:14-3-3 protein 7 isoform X2 [Mycena kentingensis (nom. inval.)]|nr:14-3-3 protein 7 isoform X2 [Mycena kentingensis (nom. inval.)]